MEYLREFKYMADCAEMNLDVIMAYDHLQLHWAGFSDTLPVFIKETLEKLVQMRTSNLESIFNQ